MDLKAMYVRYNAVAFLCYWHLLDLKTSTANEVSLQLQKLPRP
jgi:hypothetical protein